MHIERRKYQLFGERRENITKPEVLPGTFKSSFSYDKNAFIHCPGLGQ